MDLDFHETGNYQRCMIVMGLLPCSTKRLQLMMHKFYITLLVVTFIGASAYGIHHVHQSLDVEKELMISLSVMTICFISDVSTLVVILLEVLSTSEQYVEFVNKYRQIYIKFHDKTGHRLHNGTFGALMRRKYGYVAAILVGGIMTNAIIVAFNYYYGFFWYTMLIILIIRARFLQMSLYIDILQNYLRLLNNQLQQIVTLKLNKTPILLQNNCSALESIERLLILKEIYTDIAQGVELYNNIFGWSIVTIIVCNYLGITVHLYWLFLTLDGFYQQHFIYIDFAMLIPLFTILFIFGYKCEELHRSQYRTASLVKRLICIAEPSYKALAYEFLLQIYSKPLHVSAKGFFQADMGMLMALGAYIASMMVILVQFSLTEFEDRGYQRIKHLTNEFMKLNCNP